MIDIGGSWVKGYPTRSVYQFELLVELVKHNNFHLAQEFYWYNPAKLPSPAEWVTVRKIRVKDSVETIWWLSKTPFPQADNKNVLQPYSKDMQKAIKERVEFIGPLVVYAGEDELLALAQGGLRVLNGEEEAKEY